jgi:hypothetical protein
MAQEPPKGKALMEYLVSPISTLNNLGPIPRENSTTPIPQTFAIRKWPSSWIRIMAPRISIDKMIFIWLNAFLS